MTEAKRRREACLGCLLGTAVGDALGLPAEGMKSQAVIRRFMPMERFRLFGKMGFISDDTEQSALVAQSLIRGSNAQGDADAERLTLRHFRRALVGWFWRLPFGIGLSTLRACLKLTFGLQNAGIQSAGNGAAMRAAVVGVYFEDDAQKRHTFSRLLARTTHTDERAVDSALFMAEVAAHCVNASPTADRLMLLERGLQVLKSREVKSAVAKGIRLAEEGAPLEEAAKELGNTGYVVHSVGVVSYAFRLCGDDPMKCIRTVIAMGGDTDTHAAMVGAWVGTLHGPHSLDEDLMAHLVGGPFGPAHLHSLGIALSERRKEVRSYFWPAALLRNLMLYPVVLAHGFRRLLPF